MTDKQYYCRPETVARLNHGGSYVTVLQYSKPEETYDIQVSPCLGTPFTVYRDTLKEAMDVAVFYAFNVPSESELDEFDLYYRS